MADMLILPLCYCTAHDGPHVHLPVLRDAQYGLKVYAEESARPAPTTPRSEDGGGKETP